ncbi:hypothetical protein PILCRDRAFT_710929 [Piloderma croceum F 1598]|uniref:Uncharacterized protein n=1 Tax=Piloderma croceum (strain F 1598) TaxID=765440 RepID=A0A0C3AK05_PILCF|nr:hypothetical protein PILCRDRAFT_710929 [Piloderma croceum F 1598]
MRPISNSPEMLLDDTVEATASARLILITHNALTIGGVSVELGAVTVCFWSGSGISFIVEAGGRLRGSFRRKLPFSAHYMASSLRSDTVMLFGSTYATSISDQNV